MQQGRGSLRSQSDPSVCHFELRCTLGGGRGSHSRCSRVMGPLRTLWEPSIRGIKPRLIFSRKGDSPFRCIRAAAPFGRSESPSFDICHPMRQTVPRISLPIQHRTGLSLLVKQSLGSLRSQCEPSVCHWSYAAYSATDEALPPGAAELQAPFSHSESPPSDTSNRASFSAARGTLPSGAAEQQLPLDAARVPHLISAIVLLF